MKVEVTSAGPAEVDTDVLAVTLAEDGELPAEIADAAGAADAKPAFKKLALLPPVRPAGSLVVGVG
ncbi:MAG: hypothetical protein ACHQJ5_09300 [Vicinamibacteria bacterium]